MTKGCKHLTSSTKAVLLLTAAPASVLHRKMDVICAAYTTKLSLKILPTAEGWNWISFKAPSN